ncbi:unnamed protein product [Hermetia illucens]|uniref:Uncharacterized protein n=1 Tax=Hermetia illucens TaxID=343691 RepID=A0A7R8UL10_HERIL|nr:unnamed protein product [Hermetia illucens]
MYVKGSLNSVPDALSRLEGIETTALDPEEIAVQQQRDEELKNLLDSTTSSLQLKEFPVDNNRILYCDVSTGTCFSAEYIFGGVISACAPCLRHCKQVIKVTLYGTLGCAVISASCLRRKSARKEPTGKYTSSNSSDEEETVKRANKKTDLESSVRKILADMQRKKKGAAEHSSSAESAVASDCGTSGGSHGAQQGKVEKAKAEKNRKANRPKVEDAKEEVEEMAECS